MFTGLSQDPATYAEEDPFRWLRTEHADWFQAASDRLLKGSNPHGANALREITARAVQRRQYHPEAVRLLILTLLGQFVFGTLQHCRFPREFLNNAKRFSAKERRAAERHLRYWQSVPQIEGEPIQLVQEEQHREAICQALDQHIRYSKEMLQWCSQEMGQQPTGQDQMALFCLHVAISLLTGQPHYPQMAHLVNAVPPPKKSSRPKHWKADTLRKTIERMRHKDPGRFAAVELALGVAHYL
jgi:hypothetical protein